jgi:hypothetical protein
MNLQLKNLKGEDVTIKFNLRTELIFEEGMSKSFTGINTSEWIFHMYAAVLANTNDTFIDFTEFTDWLSLPENIMYLYDYIEAYTEYQKNIIELRKKAKKKNSKKTK